MPKYISLINSCIWVVHAGENQKKKKKKEKRVMSNPNGKEEISYVTAELQSMQFMHT